MAYDQLLADRLLQALKTKGISFVDKKMMGGLIIMVNDKMCVGVVKNNLMIRVSPEQHIELLQQDGCIPVIFSKRELKGYLMVEPNAIDMDEDLDQWIQKALDFNPFAKSSRKK